MPSTFEKPTVLKEALRVQKGNTVITAEHLEYHVGGKAYPKLVISVYNTDRNGFPVARPKSVGLPIECSEDIAKAILKLAK